MSFDLNQESTNSSHKKYKSAQYSPSNKKPLLGDPDPFNIVIVDDLLKVSRSVANPPTMLPAIIHTSDRSDAHRTVGGNGRVPVWSESLY